jgi:hypothetical protein
MISPASKKDSGFRGALSRLCTERMENVEMKENAEAGGVDRLERFLA